ncbi:conserved hypothetical protein [Histoplasma mississippiense (nom. inval.)]|uniref:conserved hypothetical protein n=1 Tax=Ajellomyces capsulatus (strain NAm1 / WU24) TaxID=2059318 RepID=UPI000157D35F|nr:conserved hypothetical protein [Histoplasma mississippiense (nom. inval.)]EDN04788.1 conserved hypothetical protein [Histoplasma mississippiense (nom. inval.)]
MRRRKDREPIILVIDFHHARGPEVEHCFCKQGADVLAKNDWSLLPFMALSDGAHASTEDFSYFTLQQSALDSEPATSLFGISCTRQIDSASLINRPPEVTRSTVQKAVVAVIDEPRHFGQLRQKLSIVTSAWFAQRDFSDTDILKIFQESLAESLDNDEGQQDGILVLAYMGLPLQIFGKGSMFGPYIPLQRLDLLADYGTKSYVVGSTNSLLLQQKDRYSDILINLDENTINISSPSLRSALSLSAADRRWIDFLTQSIYETWDDAQPERPNTHGYLGSEEFIRLQFEEYLLALLSCEKLHHEIQCGSGTLSPGLDIEGDPVSEFGTHFLERWRTTPNYALFHRLTSDSHLFSIVEPRHPCAGGLGIHDIQRRLAQQIAELHLDERVREGREALNKHLATGQKRVNFAFNSFWADINQRKKNEQQRRYSEELAGSESVDNKSISSPRTSISTIATSSGAGPWSFGARKAPVVDIAQAQATVAAAGQRASSYFSSWGAWANDRRKEWQEKKASGNNSPVSSTTPLAFPQSLSLTTTQSSNYPGDLAGKNREGVQGKGHDSSGSVSSPSSSFSRKGWGNLLWKSSGTHSFDPDIQNNVNHNNSSAQIPRGSRDLNRRDISIPDNENDSNRTNSNARIDDAIAVSSTDNPSPPKLPPTTLPSRDKDSVPPSMAISAPISPPTLTAADKQQLKDQPLEPAISPLNLDEPVRCDPFTVVDLSAPTQSSSNSEATEALKAEKK